MDFIVEFGESILIAIAVLGLVFALFIIYFLVAQNRRRKQDMYYRVPRTVDEVVSGAKPRERRKMKGVVSRVEDTALPDYLSRVLNAPTPRAQQALETTPFVMGPELSEAVENCSQLKQANEIAKHVDNLESNLVELVAAVAADPLLSVNVLKASNAARFGRQVRVTSLKTAVEILGQQELKYVIYREYVMREFQGKSVSDANLLSDLWHHSILCAVTAGAIAPIFPGLDRARLYTAALLHDIGKFIVLRTRLLEQSRDYCRLPYCGPYFEDNKRIWNVDHALVGREAAQTWGLDSSISRLIGRHHQLESQNPAKLGLSSSDASSLMVLHLANQLAKYFSGEPRMSNYPSPMHFTCAPLIDKSKLLNILVSREFQEELTRVMDMRL